MHSHDSQLTIRKKLVAGGSWRRALTVLAAAVGIAASPPIAHAEQTNPYSVTEPINLIWAPATLIPELKFDYYVYAFAVTNSCTSTQNPVNPPVPGNLLLTSRIPIGLGEVTKEIEAATTNSAASATSYVNITTLQAGSVQGSYTTSGEVHPSATGCPQPVKGAGRATAESKADVIIKNGPEMRKGKVGTNPKWQSLGKLGNVEPSTGRGRNRITATDPIIARLIDHTTGITTEYVLLSILVSAGEGFINWDNGIISSNAEFLSFDLKIESPVTMQQGRLRLIVEEGLVTERIATGMFSGGMGFPDVGQSGAFTAAMPPIMLDYDLGGDDTHDLETEFSFSEGVAKDDVDAGLESGGSLINDIGVGFEGSNVSVLPAGDLSLGFVINSSVRRIADRFAVAPGTHRQLTFLDWPVYQIGVDSMDVAAAYVRLWQGDPANGGVPIAGDMITNRLVAVHPTNIHRVGPAAPASSSRKVKSVMIDMQWAPVLTPGEYWIEVGIDSLDGGLLYSPPGVWKSPADAAIRFDPQANVWSPVLDGGSLRPVSFPFQLYGEILPGQSCPADITNDGLVNVSDLLVVINSWGQPGGIADLTQDGIVNVSDLLAVINQWGGCGS